MWGSGIGLFEVLGLVWLGFRLVQVLRLGLGWFRVSGWGGSGHKVPQFQNSKVSMLQRSKVSKFRSS